MVKPGWAWPSRSETTLIGVPAATSKLAWVWRRSWNRMRGMPVRARCRSKSWLIDSGCSGAPDGVGEDRVSGLDRVAVASLPSAPAFEDRFGGRVEVDASSAGACLDRRPRRIVRRRLVGCGRSRSDGCRVASHPSGVRRVHRGACRWWRRGAARGRAAGGQRSSGTGGVGWRSTFPVRIVRAVGRAVRGRRARRWR